MAAVFLMVSIAHSVATQGTVVNVSTIAQLQAAVASLSSNTSIVIAPGTYRLSQEMAIRNGVRNVTLRGATSNRDDVVILGSGMNVRGVNIPLKIENAQDVTIANLSIGEAFFHPIQMQGEAGAERVRISNVRLFDAGQQFLKSTVDFSNPNGVDDVIVEHSLIEYTVIGPDHGYTEGIDVHHGARWIIRHNLFRNIHVPANAPDRFRPAVLVWSGSRDTTVHGNTFINCERGIIFGLGPQPPFEHGHSGGSIYNNFIYRTEPVNADAGISLWDSPGTRVYHNTVIQNGTYPAAIEYRFPETVNVEIINNLTDGTILRRDGAQGVVHTNYTQATASLFVNAAAADLHLAATAVQAIDQGATLPEVLVDFDGDSRSGAPDLGADERRVAGANQPPAAALTATPPSGPAPLTVTFDGRGSSDPEGSTLTYTWTFGDGQTGTGATVAHTYAAAGNYTATLRVADTSGNSDDASLEIVVGTSAPPGGPTPTLAAPTNVRSKVKNQVVGLIWRDNATNETGYQVERSVGSDSSFEVVAHMPANATSYINGWMPPDTYRYRVRAVAGDQFSEYSAVVTVQVR